MVWPCWRALLSRCKLPSFEDARIDLQILNMVEDARSQLAANDYPVRQEGILLDGYSASGNFVERFVALHPEEVVSATAGGLNGMVTLPVEEVGGQAVNYHIGIADLEDLTGEPFDLEAFREVPQFLHMGELDTNDTIPFNDAWTGDDFRQRALDVYGDDMQEERFPFCRAVHEDVGSSAVFRMYMGEGHNPRPALEDIVEFHERSLAGDDIGEMRADLGGNVPHLRAYIEFKPHEPVVGEQVAFDATRSSVRNRTLVEYEWEFSDGGVATGDLVTHTFETHGGHNVRLKTTDDRGDSYQAIEQIVVDTPANRAAPGHSDDGAGEPSRDAENEGSHTTAGESGGSQPMPGFTSGLTVAAVATFAYVRSRFSGQGG